MSQPKTELSEFLQKLRGASTQTEFQDELNELVSTGKPLPANYVSLVERGARQTLLPKFLEALEKRSGRSGADLEAMNRQISAISRAALNATPHLDIVTGHTAWASALIGAAFSPASENAQNLRLATCSKRPPLTGKVGTTFQPDGDNARFIEIGGLSVKDFDSLESVADPSKSYHFTAADARDALDAGWADVIAVPSALIGREEREYRSIARLVASASACVMLTRETLGKRLLREDGWSRVASEWPAIAETWDINSRMAATKIKQQGKVARIGAEPRTIAQFQISEMCRFAGLKTAQVFVPIDIRSAGNPALKSIDDLRESKEAPSLDAVLLWMPQAAWVLDSIAKNPRGEAHALISLGHCPDGKDHPTPLFEFNLVTTRDKAQNREAMLAVKELIHRIAKVSGQIATFRDDSPSPLVDALAIYFGVANRTMLRRDPLAAMERAMRVIGPVGYDVSLPPESLDLFN